MLRIEHQRGLMQHENLKQRMQRVGLKGGDLAALVNVAPSKISEFFRGRRTIDAGKVKEIEEVLRDLERLPQYFPIPVGVHDMKLLALALERLRAGRFDTFHSQMQGTDWSLSVEEKLRVEREFPRVFKSKSMEE